MQAIAGASKGATLRPAARPAQRALRLARFALALTLGAAVLLIPHLVWRRIRPLSPSPLARLYLRVVCAAAGLRVRVQGHVIPLRGLIVANHISWTDILVLGGAARLTFVAKSEVRDWPGLGLLARLAPTVFVRRGSRSDAIAQRDIIAAAARHGAVALFPEGTTGDGQRVLPFRTTLFAAALEVSPIAIAYAPPPGATWSAAERAAFAWDGDKPFLPHVIAVVAAGGACCTLDILPAVGGADRKQRASAARDAIVDALAR